MEIDTLSFVFVDHSFLVTRERSKKFWKSCLFHRYFPIFGFVHPFDSRTYFERRVDRNRSIH